MCYFVLFSLSLSLCFFTLPETGLFLGYIYRLTKYFLLFLKLSKGFNKNGDSSKSTATTVACALIITTVGLKMCRFLHHKMAIEYDMIILEKH